jgi:Holliday junction DNA helicase RuvA
MTAATALEEALEALRALGYAEKEIKKVLPHLKKKRRFRQINM